MFSYLFLPYVYIFFIKCQEKMLACVREKEKFDIYDLLNFISDLCILYVPRKGYNKKTKDSSMNKIRLFIGAIRNPILRIIASLVYLFGGIFLFCSVPLVLMCCVSLISFPILRTVMTFIAFIASVFYVIWIIPTLVAKYLLSWLSSPSISGWGSFLNLYYQLNLDFSIRLNTSVVCIIFIF
jgi:hypothetical protein